MQDKDPMHIMVDKMHHIMSNDNYAKELKNIVISTQNSNNQFEKRMLNKVLKILDVSDEQRKVIDNLIPKLVGY